MPCIDGLLCNSSRNFIHMTKTETALGTRLPKVHVFSPFDVATEKDPKLHHEIWEISCWAGDSPFCNSKKSSRMGRIHQSVQKDPKLPTETSIPILKNEN